MFDVMGLVTIDNRPLPQFCSIASAFSREPWASQTEIIRRKVDTPGFDVICLRRTADPEDYAESNGCHLFLIGEAFARMQTPGSSVGTGRLSAGVLLETYLERGTGLLDAIKGNFTIVILNEQMPKHQILTSRFAISPLYYARVNGLLYFSTSVAEIGHSLPSHPELDLAAVVETVLLNWPMHERTFLRHVKRVSPGMIVTIRADGVLRQSYWDQRDLYGASLLKLSEALECGSDLFHRCANVLVNDQPKVCASFTAGFDSRAMHAVLDKDRSQILSYSFGISGSVNVSIPQRICSELGYPFKPIYLDESFEDVFDVYAYQTVTLSDGLVVQRANYPYAFHQLSAFAPVVITGIFGSEMLRTFQNVGNLISESFVRLNRHAEDPVSELRRIIEDSMSSSYLLPEVYAASQEEVETDVANWFEWSRDFSPNQRLYLYLISEANRKWFGAELSTERVYATNRFPYLDDEFVEFIFQAPFSGVYSQPITPTVADRFSSQYFYAYLIRKYRPELLPYRTGRGYSPADLLKPLPLLHVGPKHLWSGFWRRHTRYREFRPQEWLTQFYHHHLSLKAMDNYDFIAPKFEEDFRRGVWLSNLTKFDKVAALRLWLDTICEEGGIV